MAINARRRFAGAVAAAAAISVLTATTAFAGGWANAVLDEPPADPPTSGQPIVIGFQLMQHGVTPVDWGSPTVTLTEATTGARVSATAHQEGPVGHWVAELTVPSNGTWSWTVRHDLEIAMVDFDPLTVGAGTPAAVTGSAGVQPALLIAGAFLAMIAALVLAATALGLRAARREPVRT